MFPSVLRASLANFINSIGIYCPLLQIVSCQVMVDYVAWFLGYALISKSSTFHLCMEGIKMSAKTLLGIPEYDSKQNE